MHTDFSQHISYFQKIKKKTIGRRHTRGRAIGFIGMESCIHIFVKHNRQNLKNKHRWNIYIDQEVIDTWHCKKKKDNEQTKK